MTTYRPANYNRNGAGSLEQSTFGQASAVADYSFYSELNTANQGYNAKVFHERQFAKEALAKKEVKSSKLAALLEQVQDNLKGSRVRSTNTEITPKISHSSTRNQTQAQTSQAESKKYNRSIFNDTQERYETESNQIVRNSYEQGMSALQASESMENSQIGVQASAQPHGIRNNSLYKFLNQYLVDKVPKGDQSPTAQTETKTIKQVPSQENLLQNCKSTTSSIGTTPTCDSYTQLPENKSSLRDKLAATMKSLSNCGATPVSSNKKKSASENWAVEKAHLLKYLNKDATDLSGNEAGAFSKKVIENPRARWSQAEDEAIVQGYKTHGANWNLIAKELPTRTVQMIRKRFTALKKKLPNLVNEMNQSSDLNSVEQSSSNEEFEIYASASKKVCKEDSKVAQEPKEFSLFGDFQVAEKEQDFLSPMFRGNDFFFENQNHDLANQFLAFEGNFLDGGVLQGAAERKKSLELDFGLARDSVPVESANQFNDSLSFFDLKFEDNAEKVNVGQDCWNDMIDFNQEIQQNHSLTPIANKPEQKPILFSKNMPESENLDRIQLLISQIKSIEMMFSVTRKEIHKLQNKFGDQ